MALDDADVNYRPHSGIIHGFRSVSRLHVVASDSLFLDSTSLELAARLLASSYLLHRSNRNVRHQYPQCTDAISV